MFDTRNQLTLARCIENHAQLSRLFGEVANSGLDELIRAVPITHTFSRDNAESIFAIGLLSCVRRGALTPDKRAEFREKLEIGLEHYVYGYLGIHQPWYSKGGRDALNPLPVGVFFSMDMEPAYSDTDVRAVNSTFRDVAVARIPASEIDRPLEKYLITADHARRLCGSECATAFAEQFWKYWGSDALTSDASRLWERFYEFHYLHEVSPFKFSGILLPRDQAIRANTGASVLFNVDPLREELARRFDGLGVWVGEYDWSEEEPDLSFYRASYERARKFAETGSFE